MADSLADTQPEEHAAYRLTVEIDPVIGVNLCRTGQHAKKPDTAMAGQASLSDSSVPCEMHGLNRKCSLPRPSSHRQDGSAHWTCSRRALCCCHWSALQSRK